MTKCHPDCIYCDEHGIDPAFSLDPAPDTTPAPDQLHPDAERLADLIEQYVDSDPHTGHDFDRTNAARSASDALHAAGDAKLEEAAKAVPSQAIAIRALKHNQQETTPCTDSSPP